MPQNSNRNVKAKKTNRKNSKTLGLQSKAASGIKSLFATKLVTLAIFVALFGVIGTAFLILTHAAVDRNANIAEIRKILVNPNITHNYVTSNGATLPILNFVAQNGYAYTTCTNGSVPGATGNPKRKYTEINTNLLRFVNEVGSGGQKVLMTALTDKCHSYNSLHYQGRAVDIDNFTRSKADIRNIAAKYGGSYLDEGSHLHISFPSPGSGPTPTGGGGGTTTPPPTGGGGGGSTTTDTYLNISVKHGGSYQPVSLRDTFKSGPKYFGCQNTSTNPGSSEFCPAHDIGNCYKTFNVSGSRTCSGFKMGPYSISAPDITQNGYSRLQWSGCDSTSPSGYSCWMRYFDGTTRNVTLWVY